MDQAKTRTEDRFRLRASSAVWLTRREALELGRVERSG